MSRRQLLSALARREFGLHWVLGLLMAGAGTAYVAFRVTAPDALAELDPVAARVLRRFDLTVLAVSTLFGALRVAQRTAEDRAAGWLAPFAAGGGGRGAYPPLLATAVLGATFTWFAVAAGGFAIAVALRGGSAELLRPLPLLLVGGGLLQAGVILFVALFGMLLGDALTAFGTAFVTTVAPYAAVMMWVMRRGEEPSLLLRLWLQGYPPPLALPTTFREVAGHTAYLAIMTAALAAAGSRRTGRNS